MKMRLLNKTIVSEYIHRFLKKISISNYNFYKETPCWEWTASKFKAGYGQFGLNGKNLLAHRVSYKFFIGKIPESLQINHKCRNRKCVNSTHLETITQQENIRIGETGLINHSKTHCPQNHEYTKENTYVSSKGSRYCKTCGRIYALQSHYRKKLELKHN